MSFVDYKHLDQKIWELSRSSQLNLLTYVTPQNLEQEKEKFLKEFNAGVEYNPLFIYPSKNPLYNYFALKPSFEIYKSELKELLKNLDSECFGLLCEGKILDFIESMELMKSVGTANFSENSNSYFGFPDNKLYKSALQLVKEKDKINKSKIVSLNEAQTIIKNFLAKKKIKYKLVLRDSSSSKFSVFPGLKTIYINKNTKFDSDTLKRFIAHEIETHIYRYENGLAQPYSIFTLGTSRKSLETEEGLAVNNEKAKKIEISSQLKVYAGRVVAIQLASRKSFYEVFKFLRDYFSEEEAFELTLRAKRGTLKTSEPGAFTKDLLYYKGMFVVEEFLKENPIEDLYYGKYAADEVALVKGVAGIKKPKFFPEINSLEI